LKSRFNGNWEMGLGGCGSLCRSASDRFGVISGSSKSERVALQ
jgi:hypothetical protein